MHRVGPLLAFTLSFWLLILAEVPSGFAYSVLTHDQIVDLAWNPQFKPLLLEKFPNTTPEQLIEAHAYAYGGCVVQDLGYYPFGTGISAT